MTLLTKVRVCVAAAGVVAAASTVWAQQPAAGAPAYASGAGAAAAAPTTEEPKAAATAEAAEIVPAGEELIAGRPGFVESRGVVQRGVLQFEGGWSYEGDAGEKTSTLPGAVMRFGLGHGVELRGANLGFSQTTFAAGDAPLSGASDVQLGAKVMLLTEHHHAPFELAVEPALSIPTGAPGVTSTTFDPSLTLSFGRELPAGFDATGLVRATRLTLDGERLTQYAAAVSVAHSVFKPWTASAEVVVISGGPAELGFSTALARKISERCQIDFQIGHGLSAVAPTWTFGAGIVVR